MAVPSWPRPGEQSQKIRDKLPGDDRVPADHWANASRTPIPIFRFRSAARDHRAEPNHTALLHLDAGGLHHLRPALQLALDERVELLRRAADDIGGLRANDGGAHVRHLEHL